MSDHFNLYFAGELVSGADPETARSNLAKLLKASPQQLQKLFDGRSHLLKKHVDKSEAIKYRKALQQAGIKIQVKPAATPTEANTDTQTGLSLAATGSDLLRPEERPQVETVEVNIDHLQLISPFLDPEPMGRDQTPIEVPDLGHISLAEPGAAINPNSPAEAAPFAGDLQHISLAPAGADLEQLPDQREKLNPQTEHISLSPDE